MMKRSWATRVCQSSILFPTALCPQQQLTRADRSLTSRIPADATDKRIRGGGIYRLRGRRPVRRSVHERAHAGSGQEMSPFGSFSSFCSTSTLPHSGQMLSWQSGNSFLQSGQNIQYKETGRELKNVLRIRPFREDALLFKIDKLRGLLQYTSTLLRIT